MADRQGHRLGRVVAGGTYQQLRQDRVQKILAGGRQVNNDKAAGPVARVIRDALLPILSKWLARAFAATENCRID